MGYRDNAQPSAIVSGDFDGEVVTIAGNVGQGADQDCREVQIWIPVSDVVRIGGSAASAVTGPILPTETSPLRIAISNTNKLFFNGTNGDLVNIIWRS